MKLIHDVTYILVRLIWLKLVKNNHYKEEKKKKKKKKHPENTLRPVCSG